MVSPYREASAAFVEVEVEPNKPLAQFTVSGAAGKKGRDGVDGAVGSGYGAHGQDGGDAGPAQPGQDAGTIRLELKETDGLVALRGEALHPDGKRENIAMTIVSGETGFIELRAIGGRGGDGGNGGHGGDGAPGRPGDDATRYRRGTDGGDGGDGGNGGNATSGAPGGRGGAIVVEVSEEDTPLLMLVDHDVRGGEGGNPGRNGLGGSGGPGGPGGDSYSWSVTETYRDANGNLQTRTRWHSNPGGTRGSDGTDGHPGTARVTRGANGAPGTFEIRVRSDAGVASYPSRYDLRLVDFEHDSLNEDCVYEPGEVVRVFGMIVENTGGMPTPAKDDLRLSLVREGWVVPEDGDLVCPPSLAPDRSHRLAGELRFRIKEHEATEPGDPLEVDEMILHRALLPSVRRSFEDYQSDAAIDAGRFVIRYPVRVSPVTNLRSLAPGQATRVRFSVVNQSRLALGAKSDGKRVLRARVLTAPDSELDDEHVQLSVGGKSIAPSEGYLEEIDVLGAGEERVVEVTLRVLDGAPEYRRYVGRVVLELGRIDEPAQVKSIQLRAFDVRVAHAFRAKGADMLLVVNHKTTREELAAWEAVASELATRMAIWDLSLERHLDLEAPVAGDESLLDLFAGGTIAILDNEIEGPEGPARPHQFLCPHQVLRAAQAGIDIAVFGKGLALPTLLVPNEVAGDETTALVPCAKAPDARTLVGTLAEGRRASLEIHTRYWLRFWARPEPEWLAERAHAISRELAARMPHRRHIVVHRYSPEVVSSFLWIKKWRVGTVEALRTLDTAEGALIHVDVADDKLHDPELVLSDDATTALLLAFAFAGKLERLRELAAADEPERAAIDRIVDLIVCDLADELAAVLGPEARARASREALERMMPRLLALSASELSAAPSSVVGTALLQLAGRVVFLAESQVSWFARVPPLRWMHRAPAVAAFVREHVERFLTSAFGTHNLETVQSEVRAIGHALRREYKRTRLRGYDVKLRTWAIDQFRAPLADHHITSDVEVLTRCAERVLTEEEYAQIAIAKQEHGERRRMLMSAASQAHRDLLA